LKFIVKNLRIPIETDGTDTYLAAAASKMSVSVASLSIVKILSKNLDLSDKSQFYY
jgi:hypothetical protein